MRATWGVFFLALLFVLPRATLAAEKAYPMLYYSADGKIDKDKLEKAIGATVDILVKYNLIAREKVPSMSDLYTERFLGQ